MAAFRKAFPYLILAAAALLAFGAVLPGEFVVDDLMWAPAGRALPSLDALLKAFGSWGFQNSSLKIDGPPIYRPLHVLFIALFQYPLGPYPWAWHLLSLALHVLNAALVFKLLERLLPEHGLPLRIGVTLLFVLHPAGSEAVLWISSNAELTVTAMVVGTALLYLRWRERMTPLRIGAMALFYMAACLFKETALVLPLLLGAFELIRGRRQGTFSIPLAVVAVVVAGLFLFLRQGVIGSTMGGQPMALEPSRILAFSAVHLRFLLLPWAPPFALRPPETPLASSMAIAAAVLVLAGLVLAWRLAKGEGRALLFGALWILLTLWPAYAVAVVDPGYFNGRQAYLPTVGLALLAGAVMGRVPARHQSRLVLGLLPLLAWMGFATAMNATIWRRNLRVYETTMTVSPTAEGPRAGMAESLERAGDLPGAFFRYSEAAARATTPDTLVHYLYSMARIQAMLGRLQDSDGLLQEILRIAPNYSAAWAGRGNNASTWGRLDDAIRYYQESLRCDPGNQEAAINLRNVLAIPRPALPEAGQAPGVPGRVRRP